MVEIWEVDCISIHYVMISLIFKGLGYISVAIGGGAFLLFQFTILLFPINLVLTFMGRDVFDPFGTYRKDKRGFILYLFRVWLVGFAGLIVGAAIGGIGKLLE